MLTLLGQEREKALVQEQLAPLGPPCHGPEIAARAPDRLLPLEDDRHRDRGVIPAHLVARFSPCMLRNTEPAANLGGGLDELGPASRFEAVFPDFGTSFLNEL